MANPAVLGSAAVVTKRSFVGRCLTCARRTPLFFYVLLFYVGVELAVPNVRAVFVNIGPFELSWVEVIHVVATMAAMGELLRVSRPGIDNTFEALAMAVMFVVYLVLFVVAATGVVEILEIFNRSEFVALLLISGTQVVLAFLINARTLKRTIDYTHDG